MKLLGFNFKKISAERFPSDAKLSRIAPNISIKSIKKTQADFLKTKEEILVVDFSYEVSYDEKFAKIELAGDLLVSAEPKIVKEILKAWRSKNIQEDFRVFLFNIILAKSNIKALGLEDELNLPAHIQMPMVRKESFDPKKNKRD